MKTSSLVLVLAIAGCGSAAGPGYDPPIVTIDGVFSSLSVATPPRIHVSLMWERVQLTSSTQTSFGGIVGYVAQDITVAPEIGGRFHLAVTRAPPPEVINIDGDVKLPLVLGIVVAWVDGNGNGVLDPVPADSTTSPDTILGTSASYVFYSTEQAIHLPTYSIEPGFNEPVTFGAVLGLERKRSEPRNSIRSVSGDSEFRLTKSPTRLRSHPGELGQHISRFMPERYRETHAAHIRRFADTGVTNRQMGSLGAISGQRAMSSTVAIKGGR